MNDLFTAPPRTVSPVVLKSRPELALYLLTLNYFEFLAMGRAVKELKEGEPSIAVEVEHTLCDAEGKLQLAPGQGEAFVRTLSLADANALQKGVQIANALSNDAMEQTEKN